jgi:hypothetical protein
MGLFHDLCSIILFPKIGTHVVCNPLLHYYFLTSALLRSAAPIANQKTQIYIHDPAIQMIRLVNQKLLSAFFKSRCEELPSHCYTLFKFGGYFLGLPHTVKNTPFAANHSDLPVLVLITLFSILGLLKEVL